MRSERLPMVVVVVVATLALLAWHRDRPTDTSVPIEVVGDVPYPGWYSVSPDATVADAVALAGGQTRLATPLGDGARVRVLSDGTFRQERGAPFLVGRRVDLNRDDRQALMRLPGVGDALAERLYDAEALQVPADALDVRGVGDAVFSDIHPLVWTPSPPARPIPSPVNFNTAELEQLLALPGVGPVLAERIVQSRTRLGPFVAARDLQRVHGIGVTRAARLATVGVFE